MVPSTDAPTLAEALNSRLAPLVLELELEPPPASARTVHCLPLASTRARASAPADLTRAAVTDPDGLLAFLASWLEPALGSELDSAFDIERSGPTPDAFGSGGGATLAFGALGSESETYFE
jgi:hypothetical protein